MTRLESRDGAIGSLVGGKAAGMTMRLESGGAEGWFDEAGVRDGTIGWFDESRVTGGAVRLV